MSATAQATLSTERTGPFINTASGHPWRLLDPRPQDVRWRAVANALSRLARFTGHQSEDHAATYSVAQHCCIVADNLPPEARLYGLLHDAHEAFIGDLSPPLKQALATLGGGTSWKSLETITDAAIHAAAGLPTPSQQVRAAVHHHDQRTLATEIRDVMPPACSGWGPLATPYPTAIVPWPPSKAADTWLDRLRRWLPPTALVEG